MPFPINSHVIRRFDTDKNDRVPKFSILKVTESNVSLLSSKTFDYDLRPVKPLDLIEMDSLNPGETNTAIVISVQGENATILIDRQGTLGTINVKNVTIVGYCEIHKFQNK